MASDFVNLERARQACWRELDASLASDARGAGSFYGREYGWLLSPQHAELNVWEPIRRTLIQHFASQKIAWHDEDGKGYGPREIAGPSPNLMDSQIACLNFWFGLAAAAPSALLAVVQTFAPDAVRLVPPVAGGPLVEPEWMGLANYLGERGERQRGKYATSADALLTWVDAGGQKHGALIESKYSESYTDRNLRYSKRGTDRLSIYARAAAHPWTPFSGSVALEALMFDPFDQHLRQQLLASAMEANAELGLTSVRLVHVAPATNNAFHDNITAPALVGLGSTVAEAWRSVLKRPEQYVSVSYEDVFQCALRQPRTDVWAKALRARYGWAQ